VRYLYSISGCLVFLIHLLQNIATLPQHEILKRKKKVVGQ
jgi:hypothetical protein